MFLFTCSLSFCFMLYFAISTIFNFLFNSLSFHSNPFFQPITLITCPPFSPTPTPFTLSPTFPFPIRSLYSLPPLSLTLYPFLLSFPFISSSPLFSRFINTFPVIHILLPPTLFSSPPFLLPQPWNSFLFSLSPDPFTSPLFSPSLPPFISLFFLQLPCHSSPPSFRCNHNRKSSLTNKWFIMKIFLKNASVAQID